MGAAVLLMLFVLFAGPTQFLLSTFVTSIGDYFANLVELSTRLFHFSDEGAGWLRGWTLTYLIWWIAWAPFVGIFVARISRGRTIREFVIGVVFMPTMFSLLWFGVFGGTGLHVELFAGGVTGARADEPFRDMVAAPDCGCVASFCGRLHHGGNAITRGTRYIIPLFIYLDRNKLTDRPRGYLLRELGLALETPTGLDVHSELLQAAR